MQDGAAVQGTILVADDDPQILSMVAMRLQSRGYKVFEARDGAEAMKLAHAERPELVVLDVMMPQMNGWEVARALRQDPTLREIGIIMLTAIGEHINELTSPLYGADEYIDKPFDFNDLEQRVAQVLKKRRG